MSARDWNRAHQQDRVRKHGAEPAARLPASKDQLRREADALLAKSAVPIRKLRTIPSEMVNRSLGAKGSKSTLNNSKKVESGSEFDDRWHRKVIRQHKGAIASRKAGFDTSVPPGLVVYADGCCHPNPGIGGWGFVAYLDGAEIHSDCGGAEVATNQTMELTAALKALQWIEAEHVTFSGHDRDAKKLPAIRLLSDSMYTVNGCNDWRHGWKSKGWRRKGDGAADKNAVIANLDLWKALDRLLIAVPIKLEWVKGHAGIIGNERADELSEIGRQQVVDATAKPDLIAQQLAYVI